MARPMATWARPMTPWNSDIPGWDIGSQDTGQLQDRHRHTQDPGQEGHQDQPEDPTPAPQHTEGQQADEASQHDQEADLRHPGAIRQPQGLIVDVRGRHQDHQQAAQGHPEEAEHQRLGPVHHRASRLPSTGRTLAPGNGHELTASTTSSGRPRGAQLTGQAQSGDAPTCPARVCLQRRRPRE